MTPEQILQARLAQIRPRFVETLAERLDRLDDLRDAIEGAPDAIDALQEIKFGAHKTAGSAATLGFADLGALCSQTEQLIANYIGNDAAPSFEDVVASIDDTLGEMALIVTSVPA